MEKVHDDLSSPYSNGDGADRSGSIGDTLQAAAGTLKAEALNSADAAIKRGADRLGGVSRAVHDAADDLGREMPQAASYIHSAAETLDLASSALAQRSAEDFIAGFGRFARKQPAALFAGAMLAGFALSRFLKSSAAPSEQSH
jgi:hypothetical protein